MISSHLPFSSRSRPQTLNPNPAMQLRYWSIVDWQSFWGSAAFEKSMHSSRLDFSSLHTQQGCRSSRQFGMIPVGSADVQRTLGFEASVAWAGAAAAALEPMEAGNGQQGCLLFGFG